MSPTTSLHRVHAPSDLRECVVSRADAASFHAVRQRLFGVAYRMLGNVAEADEVVQDTWIRWQRADRSRVRDAPAFLTMATARLALNAAQSARARRETVGTPDLPEPVDTEAGPALQAARSDELALAVSILLERLSPSERAAFVLREAFDYPYRDVSKVLGVSEENARQLVTRARSRLARRHRRPVAVVEQRQLFEALSAAAREGDLARLERVLTAGLVVTGNRRRRPPVRPYGRSAQGLMPA